MPASAEHAGAGEGLLVPGIVRTHTFSARHIFEPEYLSLKSSWKSTLLKTIFFKKENTMILHNEFAFKFPSKTLLLPNDMALDCPSPITTALIHCNE